jgi:hypothetical protein
MTQDVTPIGEPIPFVGYVVIEDKQDTEQMLREQIRAQQLEIQRLKRKIRELEDND